MNWTAAFAIAGGNHVRAVELDIGHVEAVGAQLGHDDP
jgi:hypothetical protein